MISRPPGRIIPYRHVLAATEQFRSSDIPVGDNFEGLILQRFFANLANAVAHAAGMPITFLACCSIVVLWAVSGPLFGFSDTWQLIINTGTTIITFLMVFLIQNTQNRDGAALQVKLDELIRASKSENSFIGIEHLTEEEVAVFRDKCKAAAAMHNRRAAQGRAA